MKKQSIILATIAAIVILVTLVMASAYRTAQNELRAAQEQDRARQALLVRPDSHTLGAADAKVTLVEFFDPECESCRAIFPSMKDLLKYYDGKVRLVVRYMPFHPNSAKAATALEAAAEQGRFWDLLAVMFERQPKWADHHSPRPELVRGYVQALGLDMSKYDASLTKQEHQTKIQQDASDGNALGIKATPSLFVNGRVLDRLDFRLLKGMIDEELAKP